MSAARIAVVVRPEQSPEDLVRHARYADEVGIDEVWLWEDCFFGGGIATAATVLAETDHGDGDFSAGQSSSGSTTGWLRSRRSELDAADRGQSRIAVDPPAGAVRS